MNSEKGQREIISVETELPNCLLETWEECDIKVQEMFKMKMGIDKILHNSNISKDISIFIYEDYGKDTMNVRNKLGNRF